MDLEYEDDEDEDEDEGLSPRDRETFMRAAAAWHVSADALNDDGGVTPFGLVSFGLIALGLMLDVVKKARMPRVGLRWHHPGEIGGSQ